MGTILYYSLVPSCLFLLRQLPWQIWYLIFLYLFLHLDYMYTQAMLSIVLSLWLYINGILLLQIDTCFLFHSTLCLLKIPGWRTKTGTIHFLCVAPSHCTNTLLFVYLCSCWEALGCFLFFTITSSPAHVADAHVLRLTESGAADSRGTSILDLTSGRWAEPRGVKSTPREDGAGKQSGGVGENQGLGFSWSYLNPGFAVYLPCDSGPVIQPIWTSVASSAKWWW